MMERHEDQVLREICFRGEEHSLGVLLHAHRLALKQCYSTIGVIPHINYIFIYLGVYYRFYLYRSTDILISRLLSLQNLAV